MEERIEALRRDRYGRIGASTNNEPLQFKADEVITTMHAFTDILSVRRVAAGNIADILILTEATHNRSRKQYFQQGPMVLN